MTQCHHCGKETANPKFCNRSCSASYTNRNKPPRSEESRQRTRSSLKEKCGSVDRYCEICGNGLKCQQERFCSRKCFSKHRNSTSTPKQKQLNSESLKSNVIAPYCRVMFLVCSCCGKRFIHTGKHALKTCSDTCYRRLASIRMAERLKNPEFRKNYGRGKMSYLEKSFYDWLVDQSIEFDHEVNFRNTELNKTYFADFVFKDKNLIIELDGTQHRNTIDADKIRDEFISRVHGFRIVRISHKEYQNKSRIQEICELLEVPCSVQTGIEPVIAN